MQSNGFLSCGVECLVRFRYHGYDPATGRFTCPDPLGDTGGDHDVYDYCVDDPVTMNDPSGLIPPLLLFLGAKAAMGVIATAGVYGAATGADWWHSVTTGEKTTKARDGVKRIAGKAIKTVVTGMIPGAIAIGGPAAIGAVGAIGRKGAALAEKAAVRVLASRHGDKIVKHGKDFVEAATIEGPAAATRGGAAGALVKGTYDAIKERR